MAFVWCEGSWVLGRLLDRLQQGEESLHSRLVVISEDKICLIEEKGSETSHLTSRSP